MEAVLVVDCFYFADCIYMFHIYSALSSPDRYFCNPIYSFHNSQACVMEKGFISKEFYVKNGIRQGLVDL